MYTPNQYLNIFINFTVILRINKSWAILNGQMWKFRLLDHFHDDEAELETN